VTSLFLDQCPRKNPMRENQCSSWGFVLLCSSFWIESLDALLAIQYREPDWQRDEIYLTLSLAIQYWSSHWMASPYVPLHSFYAINALLCVTASGTVSLLQVNRFAFGTSTFCSSGRIPWLLTLELYSLANFGSPLRVCAASMWPYAAQHGSVLPLLNLSLPPLQCILDQEIFLQKLSLPLTTRNHLDHFFGNCYAPLLRKSISWSLTRCVLQVPINVLLIILQLRTNGPD